MIGYNLDLVLWNRVAYNEKAAQLLGILFADGSYLKDKRYAIEQNYSDKHAYMDAFGNLLNCNLGYRRKTQDRCYVQKNNEIDCLILSKHGFQKEGGKSKRSLNLDCLPKAMWFPWLAGFFDGDGSIMLSQNSKRGTVRSRIELSFINKDQADVVLKILSAHEIKNTVNIFFTKNKVRMYKIVICNLKDVIKFSYLYIDVVNTTNIYSERNYIICNSIVNIDKLENKNEGIHIYNKTLQELQMVKNNK